MDESDDQASDACQVLNNKLFILCMSGFSQMKL
jgi:hypothetical protein